MCVCVCRWLGARVCGVGGYMCMHGNWLSMHMTACNFLSIIHSLDQHVDTQLHLIILN